MGTKVTPSSARNQTVSFPERVSVTAIQPVAACEREVAFLRAENLRLKEQLANLGDHISSTHLMEEGVRDQHPKHSLSTSKSDLVQRCLKDAVSSSGLVPELRHVSGTAATDRLGRGSDLVNGTDSIEQSFPRRRAHSALMRATGARRGALNNNFLANPLHDAASQGPDPVFPDLERLKAAESFHGHTSLGPV